jgi:hypothetical protein
MMMLISFLDCGPEAEFASACSEPATALERGFSNTDFGGFDHSNIVEDHVQRLEKLATVCHLTLRARLILSLR